MVLDVVGVRYSQFQAQGVALYLVEIVRSRSGLIIHGLPIQNDSIMPVATVNGSLKASQKFSEILKTKLESLVL